MLWKLVAKTMENGYSLVWRVVA